MSAQTALLHHRSDHMNVTLPVVLASLLFLAGIATTYKLYNVLCEAEQKALTASNAAEAHRSKFELVSAELEVSRARAHTHSVVAGIEDSTAIAIDVTIGLEAELARMNTLLDRLGKLREGPYAYDRELPSGRRPQRRLMIG